MLRPSCASWLFSSLLRRQASSIHRWAPFRAGELLASGWSKPRNVGRRCLSEIPSFREQVGRTAQVPSFADRYKKPGITKQILFAVITGGVLYFNWAGITDEVTAIWIERLRMSSPIVETREPTTEDIKRARYFHLGKRLQAWLYSLKEEASNLPQTIKSLPLFATARSMQNVLDASEARRVCWMLVMINCGVYLAWKIRRLQPAMSKGFTHNPLSGKSYTLLTSMFSHSSFWHLLLNSMALLSFSATAAQHLIREQRKSPSGMQEATVSYHLWAFFICTGLFANLFSHIAQARIIYPRLLARIASPSTPAKGLFRHMVNENTQIRGSLGASGAIYGSVVLTALAFPEAEVSLFFPPGLTLPIQWGVGGLVLLDITGILRGWRYFDHWAHLGGAIFGMLYYNYGPLVWEKTREAMKVTVDKARVERQAKYIQKLEAEYEKVISQADRKKPREV